MSIGIAFFFGLSAALGLAIGSFLNVVIYRVPLGKSVVAPGSSCPNCDHPIRAYDNIPVFSWLLLRAKCRDCGAPISVRYPIVEALTGGLFLIIALAFAPQALDALAKGQSLAAIGHAIVFVGMLAFAAFSVALAAIDFDTHRLPNALTHSFTITGLVIGVTGGLLTGDNAAVFRTLAGAAALFIAYLVIHLIRPDGMGGGDVKLAAALGAYLGYFGWGPLAVGTLAAFLLGALIGSLLIALRKIDRKGGLPFGPWMIVGAWIGVFFGTQLTNIYLSLFGLRA